MILKLNIPEDSKELADYKGLIGGKITGVVWDNVELEDSKLYGLKIQMNNGETILAWPLDNNGVNKGTLVIDRLDPQGHNSR